MSDLTVRIGATVSDNGAFRCSSENFHPPFEHNMGPELKRAGEALLGGRVTLCRSWHFKLGANLTHSWVCLFTFRGVLWFWYSHQYLRQHCCAPSKKNKSYASASAYDRSPFNGADEFNFAQEMRGFLLLLFLIAARPSNRPWPDFRDSHCGCVVIIAYQTRHTKAFQPSLPTSSGNVNVCFC